MIERFELIISSLVNITNVFDGSRPIDEATLHVWLEYTSTLQQLIQSCRSLALEWETYIDSIHRNPNPYSYRTPVLNQPHIRGRPSFQISQDQLIYLASLSFSWTEIAELLGVSRMTIYRRRRDFNMLDSSRNANLADSQLRDLIRGWKHEMPMIGETLILGRLHASGLYVQRQRVRQAIREVDPLNTALRAPHGLSRRHCYSVPAPNSLWHIGECMHVASNNCIYIVATP